MAAKTLSQVVSYVQPDLKRLIDKEISNSKTRISVSSYIESVLREHLSQKKAARTKTETA